MSGVSQPFGPPGCASGAAAFLPGARRNRNGSAGMDLTSNVSTGAPPQFTRTVRIELGRLSLTRDEAEQVSRGSVVQLAERQGDPVNVYTDELLIARGQLLLQDGRLSVRITELVSSSYLRGPSAGTRPTTVP